MTLKSVMTADAWYLFGSWAFVIALFLWTNTTTSQPPGCTKIPQNWTNHGSCSKLHLMVHYTQPRSKTF